MEWNRGSALIETLVAAVILVSGLTAVASIFSVTTSVNLRNQQRTTATLLLYDKMEQLRTTGSPAGGSLDPMNPMAGFMDYVRIDSDGTLITSSTDSGSAYLRLWQVQDLGESNNNDRGLCGNWRNDTIGTRASNGTTLNHAKGIHSARNPHFNFNHTGDWRRSVPVVSPERTCVLRSESRDGDAAGSAGRHISSR